MRGKKFRVVFLDSLFLGAVLHTIPIQGTITEDADKSYLCQAISPLAMTDETTQQVSGFEVEDILKRPSLEERFSGVVELKTVELLDKTGILVLPPSPMTVPHISIKSDERYTVFSYSPLFLPYGISSSPKSYGPSYIVIKDRDSDLRKLVSKKNYDKLGPNGEILEVSLLSEYEQNRHNFALATIYHTHGCDIDRTPNTKPIKQRSL